MAIIDVVKWEANDSEFCKKFPSNNLRYGSQLIVNTAQTAFFVKGGLLCDEFTAGTYTLSNENLPILHKIINLPFGGDSPFQAEVWFINQITRLNLKWGTPSPILVEDPKYKIIMPVRAFGQYGIRIIDPRLFLETLIGNMTVFTAEVIDSYLKGKMLSILNSIIAKKIINDQISILDINACLLDISDFCNQEINKVFVKYGISVVDFSISSINIPQDDPSLVRLKEVKSLMAKMTIAGRDIYQMERSFDVLDKAAANHGSGAQIMGLGVGMGLGNVMGGLVSHNININPQPPITSSHQEDTYFVYVNGQQLTGQTASKIAELKAQGIVDDETLVWTPGMTSWAPIKSVSALTSSCPPPVPSQK